MVQWLRLCTFNAEDSSLTPGQGIKIPVYETAKETLIYRTILWTLWERERVGRFERMALTHVKYHV